MLQSRPFQYQVQAFPPVGGSPTPPVVVFVPTNIFPSKMYRPDKKVAVLSSGGVVGGDFSGAMAVWFSPLSQPRAAKRRQFPATFGTPVGGEPTPAVASLGWYMPFATVPKPFRTLKAARAMFTNQVRPTYTGPASTVGEWYGNLSQPAPKRPGLRAALQRAPWLTPPEAVQPSTAPGAFTNGLSTGQKPRRQRVALMQAFAQGLPSYTGPATTAGTWSRVFSTPKPKRPGLRAALLPFGTISYPTVFPPPPAGGSRTIRRRFIRRGRRG